MMNTKLFILLFAVLALGACKKEIKLEVKKIHETDKTAQWDIDIHRSVFSFSKPDIEESCAKFNDEITGLIGGIHAAFIEQCNKNIALLDSANYKQVAPYQLNIQDSVFLADKNYISLLVSSYEMLGGANGITNFYGVNYDMKKRRFLNKHDILNYDKAQEINTLLKENLKDPDKCYTFEAPTVENFTALTFTLHTIDFTYAKYILGPGACGPVTISVPKAKMHGMLKL